MGGGAPGVGADLPVASWEGCGGTGISLQPVEDPTSEQVNLP